MGNSKSELLTKVKEGFAHLNLDSKYKDQALSFIGQWLSETMFADYEPQIVHMINAGDWDYLLDCFYQIIPFGTGGRRGEVGIGPNRINKWTIQASAQGHSQYLIKLYGDKVKENGVVLAYGIREFFSNTHFDDTIPNPVKNLKGRDLAVAAAQVYTANGIKTYIFEGPRTTPELSFSVRFLKAIAGDMFDASHNPPEHSGKKVYDEHGGQLIPPDDEVLVNEVTKNVTSIKIMEESSALSSGLLVEIGKEVDDAYIETVSKLKLSDARGAKIVYTPFHGMGSTSVLKVLQNLGFDVYPDPKTNYFSGKFENLTFNIPNPEVTESFDIPLKYAKVIDADILLSSDPDADRIGLMVKGNTGWVFLNGNEIGSILTRYVLEKRKTTLSGTGVVIKTNVTTNLASQIATANHAQVIGELLVGFKYIGEEMNKLEKANQIDNFLIGIEESHGIISGNYLRDKDSTIGAIWLSELASELKSEGRTILDYLDETFVTYGYFRNYLTEIRLPGAEGMGLIHQIQDSLRKEKPSTFGRFSVERIEDCLDRTPIVSETDRMSKDVLVYYFKPEPGMTSLKITIRPSGTEPKIKMYYELGNTPVPSGQLAQVREKTEHLLLEIEREFMTHCYKIIGVDFPQRGFLLFWQLPLYDKLKYFAIEEEIAKLKELPSKDERSTKLSEKLVFLGSDPTQKVNRAFEAKFGSPIEEYLGL